MSEKPTLPDPRRELAEAGQEFYRRGWVLGTSGNFSMLMARNPLRICVTASGMEKGKLDETNFLDLDDDAEILQGFGKPSAETLIHLTIYRFLPKARSILHTHSVWGTILSDRFFEQGAIEIEGYEMLKGLAGVTTHEHHEKVPIVENSQDYVALAHVIENVIRDNPDIHGIYLRRHGLYTWGETVSEARRHVEIFEFLFEVLGRSLKN
jgi:methylthioribulose-1-phosphate dehydratase